MIQVFQSHYTSNVMRDISPSSMRVWLATRYNVVIPTKSCPINQIMDRITTGNKLQVSPSMYRILSSPATQYALVFLPGLIAGRLLDLGHFRSPFLLGSIIVVVSSLITAECKKYWHFLLCQGNLTGPVRRFMSCFSRQTHVAHFIFLQIGSGICFGPTLGIVGHWFLVKRGLALSMVAVASSIGGTTYPIAARQLMPLIRLETQRKCIDPSP